MNWLNINSIHQSFIFAWEQLKINQFAVYKVFFVCYSILFIIMFHVFSRCQDSRNLYFCLCGELHWETAGRWSVRQFQWKHFPFPCTQFFPSVGEGVWPLSQHLSISEVPFFFPRGWKEMQLHSATIRWKNTWLQHRTTTVFITEKEISISIWCKNMKLQAIKKYSSGLVNELAKQRENQQAFPGESRLLKICWRIRSSLVSHHSFYVWYTAFCETSIWSGDTD